MLGECVVKIDEVIVEAIKFDPSRISDIEDLIPQDTSELIKDFRIINQEPIVIQYGNNPKKRFHLNSQGNWAYLGTDKEVDQTTSALLNQVTGVAGTKTATTTPTPVKGAQVGSKIKDRSGAIWTKGTDGKWSNPDQGVVTDPASIDKLEQASNTLWTKE